MKFNSFTICAAIIVFGAAGFFVGRLTTHHDGSRPSSFNDEAPTRSARNAGASGGGPAARDLAERRSTRAASMASGNRKDRLEAIVRGENALDRSRAFLAFIDTLGPDEFEDAVAHFRSLGITQDRMGEYSMLLTAWAKADPTAALAYAQTNTQGDFARTTILSTWAANDPNAAIRWAEANHDGDGPNPHLAGVIRGIASQDPNRATELLTSMPRSRERGQALDAMIPHLVAMGVDEARKWINQLDDEALRNGALERTASRIAQIDPAAAVDMLLANPGQAADRRFDEVFRMWASQDQSAAIDSMKSLPAGEIRSNALRGIVSNTVSRDPAAAVAMLDTYASDVNDDVIRSAAWGAFRQDPSVSVGLIARYSDPNTQNRMYRRTLGIWLEQDPAAARTWINSNRLPEDVLNALGDRLR